jgi:nitroimidazol reductase NimA-like FMN-containing flavoprotein (pyridoxamine 5'-phosphate oxidase superfamily)
MRRVELDRNGMEVLGRQQCLDLLRTVNLGRVGLSLSALPVVLPVSFVLHGDRVLIRTGAGTKLEAALAGAVVAFQADAVDEVAGEAWSVLVRGSCTVLGDGVDGAAGLDVALDPASWGDAWVAPGAERLVAISTDLVSGRRVRRQVPAGAVLSARVGLAT